MTPIPAPRPYPVAQPAPTGATAAHTGLHTPTGWLSAHPVPLPSFAARIGIDPASLLVAEMIGLGVLEISSPEEDLRPGSGHEDWFEAPDGSPGAGRALEGLLLTPGGQIGVLVALNARGHHLPAGSGSR